jgi:hypothetical protein
MWNLRRINDERQELVDQIRQVRSELAKVSQVADNFGEEAADVHASCLNIEAELEDALVRLNRLV